MIILSIICLILLLGVIIFQILLIYGLPLGEYTMGGKFPGKIPDKIKYLVFMQILLLASYGYVIAEFTDLLPFETKIFGNIGIWFVFAFFVLGTLLNWITPSRKERIIWGPVNTVILIILSLIIFA